MTVWRHFFGQFLIKIGSTLKKYFSKTYQTVFLQNLKKIKNDTHLFFWTWTLQKKKYTTGHPVNFLCQNFFGHIFFKFYIVRPLKYAQKLAFLFCEWKVMTVWRFFVDFFWFKTQFFQKSVKIAKKNFSQKLSIQYV
jgi:hypothetical protein